MCVCSTYGDWVYCDGRKAKISGLGLDEASGSSCQEWESSGVGDVFQGQL